MRDSKEAASKHLGLAEVFRFCFQMANEEVWVGELAGWREIISACGP